ncbi:MAG: Fe(2+)-trafficking protein [Acidobacteriota bacterium]
MTTVACSRCGQEKPALTRSPLPGAVGEEIVAKACSDCWGEWQNMEVMVINELRLNFMDPKSQKILQGHMREFLQMPSGDA